jgi:uncharacterized protein (DUF697 family)
VVEKFILSFLKNIKDKLDKEFLDIEKRKDLSDDEKVHQLITIGSAVCAGIAVQPIPFADAFILTPLQAYLGSRIGAVRGFSISQKKAKDLIIELSGVVGLGMLAQQAIIGVYKVGLPFLAGFTTIPLVFGATFAIGKVMDYYFIQKLKGNVISKDAMREIFKNAKKDSKSINPKEIIKDIKSRENTKNKTIDDKNYKNNERVKEEFIDQSISFLKTKHDDMAIIASLINLQNNNILNEIDEVVFAAFQRYSPKTNTLEEISNHLKGMDENQLTGVTSNVKGILHEMEFVKLENNDGDNISAALFPDTNHKGFDATLTDLNTGEVVDQIQLKATDSVTYVEEWIEKYPDEDIIVTEEIASKLNLQSSGISNEDLTVKVEDFIDNIVSIKSNDNIWSYFPYLSLFTISLVIYNLHKRFKNGKISKEEFTSYAFLISGIKVSRLILISTLLSIPIINVVTGTILISNLILSLNSSFSSKKRTMLRVTPKLLKKPLNELNVNENN